MDTMEQGDLQLAPPGETQWDHSISLKNGQLILYWHERNAQGDVEIRSRTFTNAKTEVLMTVLYDNHYHIFHPEPPQTQMWFLEH